MKLRTTIVSVAILALALPMFAQAQLVLPRVSQKATITQTVGYADITVTYSRPGVKNRTVWGDLVPWDQVWRTGANEATKFSVNQDVLVNGQKLVAGTYALAVIPNRDQWTIIFSSQADLWGMYEYDPKKDALRVTAKPQAATHQEWFEISFPEVTPNSATMQFAWERVIVPVRLEFDVNSKAMENIKNALGTAKSDDWRIAYRAADFAFNNNVATVESNQWIDQSLKAQENFYNLTLKAKMLARAGQRTEAIRYAERAIAVGKAATPPADIAPAELLLKEWKK